MMMTEPEPKISGDQRLQASNRHHSSSSASLVTRSWWTEFKTVFRNPPAENLDVTEVTEKDGEGKDEGVENGDGKEGEKDGGGENKVDEGGDKPVEKLC